MHVLICSGLWIRSLSGFLSGVEFVVWLWFVSGERTLGVRVWGFRV